MISWEKTCLKICAAHQGKPLTFLNFPRVDVFSTLCPQECLRKAERFNPYRALLHLFWKSDVPQVHKRKRHNKFGMTLTSGPDACHEVTCGLGHFLLSKPTSASGHIWSCALYSWPEFLCAETFGSKLLCNHIFQNYSANHKLSKRKGQFIVQEWVSAVLTQCHLVLYLEDFYHLILSTAFIQRQTTKYTSALCYMTSFWAKIKQKWEAKQASSRRKYIQVCIAVIETNATYLFLYLRAWDFQ